MSWQQFKHAWLIKFWAPIPAVIAAGILSTYYFGITGTFWAVTGEFTRWGGQLLQLFGVHAEEWGYFKIIHLEGSPLTRIDGMMILGMFGGCFAAALWANNVKLRMPRSRIRIMQAIIGGIIAGVFTPTEASAIAVIYSLALAMIYREITLKKLNDILLDSVVTSSIVLLLVGCSMGMSWAMTNADVPELINELITSVSDNKWVILFIINIILLIVGTFMDITPAILIFTPIFLPIAQHLGIDPIHFGIIMVFNLTIGLCTPPVGTILFVGCSIGKVSIDRAIKPLLPMFLALFVVMAIICYFPQLSLMLPGLFST